MKGCLMNHSKCHYDPFTCDHSEFLEDSISSNGINKRWVECVDYQYIRDSETGMRRRLYSEEFKLIIDGAEIIVKKGDLCVNSPVDWWETYKEFEK